MGNIREQLAEIQQRLNAPKGNYNSFAKYSYRSCEDILEAVKPLLKDTKTILTVGDDLVNLGDRFYLKATATLSDCESGESISNSAFAREEDVKKGMDASQITGSASSYARKYALNGLFCIDDVKDADTRDNRQKEAVKQVEAEKKYANTAKEPISDLKVRTLADKCQQEGVRLSTICRLYKVNTLNDLTEAMYRNINEHWQEVKNAQA